MQIKPTLLLLAFTIGCSSTTYNFQRNIEELSYREKRNAKRCIESKGYKLKEKAKILRVETVPGQRRFPRGWAWQEPALGNMWVHGLFWDRRNGRYLIQVAANPRTGEEVSAGTLQHEMGHFWLVSNHNIYHHDPTFDSCFAGWRGADVRANTILLEDGSIVIINYIDVDED